MSASGERSTASRFLRFALVGGGGFVVDAGVLWLMLHGLGADKYSGRLVSFLCAVTFTWWGNRNLTFSDLRASGSGGMFREWLTFLVANALGGAINVGLYGALVTYAPPPFDNPFVALPVGVLAGMVVNFTMSSLVVFRR